MTKENDYTLTEIKRAICPNCGAELSKLPSDKYYNSGVIYGCLNCGKRFEMRRKENAQTRCE